MNFQFPEVTECKATNVNVRREFHCDERVPAFDLSFSKEGSNELLDLIDPALRTTLYFNAAADQGQAAMPEVIAVLPNLRVPKLNAGKFKYGNKDKWKGFRFVLDFGLVDAQSNIDVADTTVEIVEFECKEGGTCILKWKVSFEADKLSDELRGRLTGLTDETVFIQLIPSSNVQLVRGKAAKTAGDDEEEQDDDATDLFLDKHGDGAAAEGDASAASEGESS